MFVLVVPTLGVCVGMYAFVAPFRVAAFGSAHMYHCCEYSPTLPQLMCPFLQQHVVEIQLHHAKFISIRENMGGHYIYSIFRSLTEAVEVVFGKDEARRLITEHSPEVLEVASLLALRDPPFAIPPSHTFVLPALSILDDVLPANTRTILM